MPTKEYIQKVKETNIAEYYMQAIKSRAKIRNKYFDLTAPEIARIITEECPILGVKLDYFASKHSHNRATVDRKDNSKGYVDGNVWIISSLANTMKSYADKSQLVKFAEWVLDHYRDSPAATNA